MSVETGEHVETKQNLRLKGILASARTASPKGIIGKKHLNHLVEANGCDDLM